MSLVPPFQRKRDGEMKTCEVMRLLDAVAVHRYTNDFEGWDEAFSPYRVDSSPARGAESRFSLYQPEILRIAKESVVAFPPLRCDYSSQCDSKG